ncbi:MAG TPA: hypothetical protein DCQ98_20785 [Planctomycetaceae bacterium]|nr:hypothetical protein [Planctomycetaceae bacterium]
MVRGSSPIRRSMLPHRSDPARGNRKPRPLRVTHHRHRALIDRLGEHRKSNCRKSGEAQVGPDAIGPD